MGHRNRVIFCNNECNPVEVTEEAKNTYYYMLLYNKNTNLHNLEDIAGNKF